MVTVLAAISDPNDPERFAQSASGLANRTTVDSTIHSGHAANRHNGFVLHSALALCIKGEAGFSLRQHSLSRARVAELADALDSGSSE